MNNMENINNQPRNNGQMGNPLINVRDRLFYALFFKTALVYARLFPRPVRRLIEFTLLVCAIISFFVLTYVHFAFSHNPATCLESISDTWPRDGIVRIQIIKGGGTLEPGIHVTYLYSQNSAQQKRDLELSKKIKKVLDKLNYENSFTNIQPSPSDSIFSSERSKPKRRDMTNDSVPSQYLSSDLPADLLLMKADESYGLSNDLNLLKLLEDSQNESYKISNYHFYSEISEESESPSLESIPKVESQYIVEYSLEYGMLRLSPWAREKLNIPVMIVALNPKSHPCFGDSFTRIILAEFLGYDDLLMSSAKALAETEENKGYLRNVITGEQFRFVSMWNARTSYIAAFLVMLLFTVTISMLLRYSHHQIFILIVDILQMLEFNIAGILPATPLLTVIMALIGMEAIMSEFFNDTTTAFYIILIVWTADQYDAVFCHTNITKKYWARFFFLYHFKFYAYHYRFNGQYSGLALVSSCLFIFHSMVYFFHHYELPEILQQAQLQELIMRDIRDISQNPPGASSGRSTVVVSETVATEPPLGTPIGSSSEQRNQPNIGSSNQNVSETVNGMMSTNSNQNEHIRPQSSNTVDLSDILNRETVNRQSSIRSVVNNLRLLVNEINDIILSDSSVPNFNFDPRMPNTNARPSTVSSLTS